MKIEELKKAKDRRPFQPFSIRMADGREIEVRHPDAVAWEDANARTAVCIVRGGGQRRKQQRSPIARNRSGAANSAIRTWPIARAPAAKVAVTVPSSPTESARASSET